MNSLRAWDKLEEAKFFVRRLAMTKGKMPDAVFYASATVQALRSVTWVLQADLRPAFGRRFDRWWESQRVELSGLADGFPAVRDARNAAVKEGAPLVRRVRRQAVSTEVVAAVEFVLDPGFETLGNFRLDLRRPLTRVDLSSDDPTASVDSVVRDAEEVLEAIRQFTDGWAQGKGAIRSEFSGERPLSFREALAMLRKYSKNLDGLLERARLEFAT